MDGESIALVRYMEGHSDLGEQTLRVELTGHPSNLTVRRMSGSALFSIPWGNFGGAQEGSVYKNGLAIAGALAMRSIPLLNLTNAASSFYDGVWVSYWDEEIERNQRVFFEAGSERKARRIVLKIYQYRDQYHRTLGKASKPSIRKTSKPVARLASKSTTRKTTKPAARKTTKSTASKTAKSTTRKGSVPKRGRKK